MFRIAVLISLIFIAFHPSYLSSRELMYLQEGQNDFDEKYFEINEGFEKIRHIFLHLVKTTGKLASYCESMEHGKETDSSQVVNEVLPDLLFHALQIANYYNVDLSEKYEERIQFIINRSQTNSL